MVNGKNLRHQLRVLPSSEADEMVVAVISHVVTCYATIYETKNVYIRCIGVATCIGPEGNEGTLL